ncbi:MAG: hypothetical protein U0531_11305 [Dehalococcoidia bacterium]
MAAIGVVVALVVAALMPAVSAPVAEAIPGGAPLYAADGGGVAGNLYEINRLTGAVIRTIGPIGYSITGLAYNPVNRVLYGWTGNNDPVAVSKLVVINTTTGAGTLVAPGSPAGGLADISFRADGVLFGWSESGDDLHVVNLVTGVTTKVGESGLNTFGSGLAFNGAGVLYYAGHGEAGALRTVNTGTGLTSVVATLNGDAGLGRAIAALDFYIDGTLYGVRRNFGDPTTDLIRINPTTGAITTVGVLPIGIDAISFGCADIGSLGCALPPPSACPTGTVYSPIAKKCIKEPGVINRTPAATAALPLVAALPVTPPTPAVAARRTRDRRLARV